MRKTIAQFQVPYLQVLDESGKVDANAMPSLQNKQVKELFELMVLTRVFDDIALRLNREGRIGTYAPMIGEEASIVGAGYAMGRNDWLFPSFREDTTMFLKGVPFENLLLYWKGDERGNRYPSNARSLPVYVPVSTQLPHAVGFAWAAKMRKEKSATIVVFGDGATSKGDFYESMNFAGIFHIPVVFVCFNNQYAISVPRSSQTNAKTLAQKAIAAGVEYFIQADGNDVFAVYSALTQALKFAKAHGPAFVECYTYRRSHHTTADDWTRYRTVKEVEAWQKKDPIDRLRKYMQSKKMWTKSYEDKVVAKARTAVGNAVKKAEAFKDPDPKDIFNYMFAKPTEDLRKQMKELED
jgi:pyruvate dehydrogenase E1 component alpha subunit